MFIMNAKLYFLLSAILSTTLAADKKRDEACTTPNGENGKCVPLNQCRLIYYAMSSRNTTILNYAKQSYCGEDGETLVCCKDPSPGFRIDLELHTLRDNTICGQVRDEPRIWGGEVTKIGEFAWMAGLEYKTKDTGEARGILCGGSLISVEFVLTAAQCLLSRDFKLTAVRLGEWDTSTDPDCEELVANNLCGDPVKIIEIDEAIPHPFYNFRSKFNDIGLIHLKEKVPFSNFIRPICLSFSELPDLEADTRLISAGWGTTERGIKSNVLLKVELPIVSKDVCNINLKRSSNPVGLHQFCAGGEDGKDTCQGDSGGPLMKIYNEKQNDLMNWYQYGIASSGVGCGIKGYPAIYTTVSDYLDWIALVTLQYKKEKST